MYGLKGLAVVAAVFGLATAAAGQEHQDVNDANNPLTPKITVNLQDYYVPSFVDVPGHPHANQFLVRGLVPSDLFGAPQLFRFTLPVAISPEVPHGYVTGLGDLTLMDIFILPKQGDITFGAGPLIVAPTATDKSLGNGKWQAGGAGIVVAPQEWGLLAGLGTYQTSFAGQHEREDVNLLTFEPIVNVNLKDGWYLRSTATWNFNLGNGASYIPVGFGVGKVFQLDKGVTMNAFIEPQYTVWNDGSGAPRWQVFAGVNFQFPIHRPAQ
ncbi:hypothetical protein [Rhizobium tumorigenes]|uniref:Neuromedin U n=1 Tax=Rhizobium tumorigenes TaxID=2041385 RepID=A0AAF1KW17_9HYPH|nr:hypothetical protein [Rhizobium tumorigenes]WFR97586.1 hypothetical protein PR017_20490 [Rhizobium tumorigenes]WFS03188.1 hypothetical protein PR016_21235 [Rhizobium tumorigenes]